MRRPACGISTADPTAFRRLLAVAAVLCLATAWGCGAGSSVYTLPKKHPRLFGVHEARILCSRCHRSEPGTPPYESLDHTAHFLEAHRQLAYRNERLCALCHRQAFCSDCHVSRSEMKPSVRYPLETSRRYHHRGDYISRHRIDGSLDPSSCYRCHGNPKSNGTCVRCHGR
ncbi:MAG: cytochrome c [Deferrisomatales bacterium]